MLKHMIIVNNYRPSSTQFVAGSGSDCIVELRSPLLKKSPSAFEDVLISPLEPLQQERHHAQIPSDESGASPQLMHKTCIYNKNIKHNLRSSFIKHKYNNILKYRLISSTCIFVSLTTDMIMYKFYLFGQYKFTVDISIYNTYIYRKKWAA